jgi:hypothetical protein
MNSVYLQSVGLVAAGLPDWPACHGVMTGQRRYQPAPLARFHPDTLPANERRRITPTIRLALQAGTEAMRGSTLAAQNVATVFASSYGDLEISDRICTALTLPGRPVSPTDFHNSVHNASAGYWSIGNHCRQPSTSLSAGNASFAAGLLEAVTQVLCDDHPVMLVSYDPPSPQALANLHAVSLPFAVALLLNRQPDKASLAKLAVNPVEQAATPCLQATALEALRRDNPSAQALLLLELLAGATAAHCVLPYLDARGLLVDYAPC